jgi:tRNA modification GTPase
MNTAFYGDDAAIAALATPAGESALALIRTSGKDALEMLARVFSRPQKLLRAVGNTVVLGWIRDKDGNRIDEALVSVYRAPKSYTGEDGADISCHGGSATVRGVCEALRSAGFRDGLPGEFTFRAFLNGKLDLTRAESVMELVAAKTDRSRSSAVHRLSGALEAEINDIKNLLVQALAETELFLDYAEDELLSADDFSARPGAEQALRRLRVLAASFRLERLYQDGALVVLAGRPNAGKSTLFNRLLKEDRSIVTDIPGTTRDWIEGAAALNGIPLRFVDTAGLRDSESGIERIESIERMGIERSRELIEAADVVLYLLDGERGFTSEDRSFLASVRVPCIILWNKADLAAPPPSLLGISAQSGDGFSALTDALVKTLNAPAAADGAAGIASLRQKALIDRAVEQLEEALSAAGQTLDLIAPLLREAVNALGEITGEVSTADILEAMFSSFCVGK